MKCERITAEGMRFSIEQDGKEVARARLYILKNDLHERPFGFLEDVFVTESVRSQGHGRTLLSSVLEAAREAGCYKLLATSRHGSERKAVHDWYLRAGFKDYGIEFRITF